MTNFTFQISNQPGEKEKGDDTPSSILTISFAEHR